MAQARWALILASVLWGTTGTAASLLTDAVSPVAIGACTMTVGGILLFAVSARGALAAMRDADARGWLLLGALGVVAYPLAFYSAMDLAGVAIGNVVSLGSGPVFAALLEWLIERHRLSRRWFGSTAVAIIGMALLSLGGHGPAGDAGSTPAGVGLGLVAGLSYALYTYASGRVIRNGHRGRAAMGGVFGLGAIGLAPVLLLTGAPLLATAQNLGVAAYLAIGPMFAAYLLFGTGVGRIRSSTVTTITLLEPVVATLLAVTVVGERLDRLGWLGLALILAAVTVLASARRPRSALSRP